MYNFFHTRFFNTLKPKTYNLKPSGGFTLIELLIVVAIIGILSSVIFVTVSNTRPRARDVQRIAEVKQLQLALTLEDVESVSGAVALTGCASSDSAVSACTGPGKLSTFTGIRDSLGETDICGASGASGACKYGIANDAGTGVPTTASYRICFYLEVPVESAGFPSGTAAGTFHIKSSTGGTIASGC
ncbi:MAG: type II secretion system protein [Parcubacteria group bacterium]|nr:type II secretion system protein [Parcubacteria group bacterium]